MKQSYLLRPKVVCRNYKFLTSAELNRLLKNLKLKKLKLKDYAVDVVEVEMTESFHRTEKSQYGPTEVRLQPGMYYHVHLEYMA